MNRLVQFSLLSVSVLLLWSGAIQASLAAQKTDFAQLAMQSKTLDKQTPLWIFPEFGQVHVHGDDPRELATSREDHGRRLQVEQYLLTMNILAQHAAQVEAAVGPGTDPHVQSVLRFAYQNAIFNLARANFPELVEVKIWAAEAADAPGLSDTARASLERFSLQIALIVERTEQIVVNLAPVVTNYHPPDLHGDNE